MPNAYGSKDKNKLSDASSEPDPEPELEPEPEPESEPEPETVENGNTEVEFTKESLGNGNDSADDEEMDQSLSPEIVAATSEPSADSENKLTNNSADTIQEPDNSMVNIQTSRPMELVCMDFLSLEPDSHNTKDILVITDHFTKYAVAIPTRDQKARTVAKCLWE